MPTTSAGWSELAHGYFDEYRADLAALGFPASDKLRLDDERCPCPAYQAKTQRILFGLPGLETADDHLFWCYHASLMGCPGPEQVIEGTARILPMLIAHEVNHHLRHQYQTFSGDHFVEEQAAQLVAMAWWEANPAYRDSDREVRNFCTTALHRLRRLAPLPDDESSYHADIGEVLADEKVVRWRQLHRAEHIAAVHDQTVEHVLHEQGLVSEEQLAAAATAEGDARRAFDQTYMLNLAEYWHVGIYWLVEYLRHPSRSGFEEALKHHLLPGEAVG